MKHHIGHVHFVGIGGAGMSGIAELLHRQGCRVSGSDLAASDTTARLQRLGITVQLGHDAAFVGPTVQALVVSSAVHADNPELRAAHDRRLPVLARAQMLAELMRGRLGVAVAGTHGKTTTSSLVATVLLAAGRDPSFVIGGRLHAEQASARLGGGEAIVVEADESDASFLHLAPQLAVVTNIDADHMETYGHRVDRLHEAFAAFVHRLPFWAPVVACHDDAGVRALLPRLQRPVLSYGLGAGAMFRGRDMRVLPGARMAFVAERPDSPPLAVELNLAGAHNVANALAAVALAHELELPDEPLVQALGSFAGVGRRFQRHGDLRAGDGGRFTLIDDYGHHPAEMAAVVAAARGAFPGRRLVLAFQPHRYTRTRDCFDGFVQVLKSVDAAFVTAVYPAGEAPVEGADAAQLAAQARATYVDELAALPAALADAVRDGDVLLVMGAGSIDAVPARLTALAGKAA